MARERLTVAHGRPLHRGGGLKPTATQVRNAAAVYHRPFSALLLPEPPEEVAPLADFRRLPTGDDKYWSPALRTAIRQIEGQRQALLEVQAVSPESDEPISEFVTADLGNETAAVAERIRVFLAFDSVAAATWTRPYDAFNAAVGAVESQGVLVVQVGGSRSPRCVASRSPSGRSQSSP